MKHVFQVGLLLGSMLIASSCMAAIKLKVCIVDERWAPVSSPEKEFPGQYLIRTATEHQGGTVTFMPAPWRRCIEGVKSAEYDMALGAAANPDFSLS